MNASQIKALRTFCKDKLDKKMAKFKEDETAAKKIALAKLDRIAEEFRIQYIATDAFINANGKISITFDLPEDYKEEVSELLPKAYPHYSSTSDMRKYLDEKVNGVLLELSLRGQVDSENIMTKVNSIFD